MAAFQPVPGYMDADAYYVGGRQLARGNGFTEPYLWNYLDNPSGIPHPSNTYWMPLASLLAAGGAALLGPESWTAARIGFILVASSLPPLTAALAWSLTSRRELSISSGMLAVFPAFYLPFLTVTDTFGLYMLLGGTFFLVLSFLRSPVTPRSTLFHSFILGIIAGLMHLARADGLLWLFLAIAAVFFMIPKSVKKRFVIPFFSILLILAGYLAIMAPWFDRNISIFGTPLAPGGAKMFWLTSYDQIFSYPASQITFLAWWQSGLVEILKVRAWSLGLNLANSVAVQGEVFLIPLIGFGAWKMHKDPRVQLAGSAWLVTLVVMTVAFPFAGARGGFFHSGAALQTVWWALAPVGLYEMINLGSRKRGWKVAQANQVFRIGVIILAGLVTLGVFLNHSFSGVQGEAWDRENTTYSHIGRYLDSQGATVEDLVMVANPPGFFLASGNPAIAVPDGDMSTVEAVAKKFDARYLVLEAGSIPIGLLEVYDHPDLQSGLVYKSEIDHARIFLFKSP
jgi:hypothetical protein